MSAEARERLVQLLAENIDTVDGFPLDDYVLEKALDALLAEPDLLLKEMGVPEDRTHPWHVVYVDNAGWQMAHPITCELTTCSYNDAANSWTERPDNNGRYAWDEDGWRPWEEQL